MWQLIQDNFISHYHEYIGDLHHMLVALSKIQTFAKKWTPLIYMLFIRTYSVGILEHVVSSIVDVSSGESDHISTIHCVHNL